MKRVLIESPYGGDETDRNVDYARAAMSDCFKRGEAPFASHLLYTQPGVLDDRDFAQRMQGIEAGLLWGLAAPLTAVYFDLGISDGMRLGISRAYRLGCRDVEFRTLEAWKTVFPNRNELEHCVMMLARNRGAFDAIDANKHSAR